MRHNYRDDFVEWAPGTRKRVAIFRATDGTGAYTWVLFAPHASVLGHRAGQRLASAGGYFYAPYYRHVEGGSLAVVRMAALRQVDPSAPEVPAAILEGA